MAMFPSQEQRPRLQGFEVLDRLGAGGVGSVYLARSKAGRLVAIKMLGDPRAELDAERKQALAREASLSARLVHPAIVQVRAFVQDGGYAALVFEYVEGVALARLLRFLASQRVRLPDAAGFYLVERVLSALAYAHGHRDENNLLVPIVHRDVSPSNVLLDWEGGVKLTDFGMAKMLGTSSGTKVGLVEGTLGCMAPEQARGESVNERADVYAAALLAWRLATGLSPFATMRNDEVELLRAMRNPRFPTLASLRPDLPSTITGAISRALIADPDQRNISAEEFRLALAQSNDSTRGHLELRAALSSVRKSLEALVAPGGVEQTYSIADAAAGQTMRYEEVALAYDRDPHGAVDTPSDAMQPLAPMALDMVQVPSTGAPAVLPRGALPSLDELTLLSELSVADIRAPPSRPLESRPDVKETPATPDPRLEPVQQASPRHVSTIPPRRPSITSRSSAPPPPRWHLPAFAAALTLLGIAVGATLAWLVLSHQ